MFLEHVNLTVSDVARSSAFYRELLGLKTRWEGTNDAGRPAVHIGGERFYIAMFQAEEPGRAKLDYDHVGLNHFGFVVEALEEIKRRLSRLGIEVTQEADYEPGHRLYFLDPDGVEVEIIQYDDVSR